MKKETKTKITEAAFSCVLAALANSLRDSDEFKSVEKHDSSYFFEGTKRFLKNPSKNGVWRLGFSEVDLTPADYAERAYYMGGYIAPENRFRNLIEEVVDDMRGRCIALDDNSGRGLSVFCTIDCIGTTNADIKVIRRKFLEKMAERFPEKKIASVNVFSTHTHSCVDTQGLWTDFPGKLLRNIRRNYTGRGILERGADEQYMRFLADGVSTALVNAVADMVEGEMFLAQKDFPDYIGNKNRPSAPSVLYTVTRLTFKPFDGAKTPTVIVNVAAHPDVAGLPVNDEPGSGRRLCGDYIHYIGETVNRAGYNFMFFNGAICAIYTNRGLTNDDLPFEHRYMQSQRFGIEMGRMVLSMTKTLDEIKRDKVLYDEAEIARDTEKAEKNGGKYTLWCNNWEPVGECKVAPLFNIRLKEVKVPITNNLICAAGKLRLANYEVLTEGKHKYAVFTEIGYIEFGKELRVALVPGEFCGDLLLGGASLFADGAVTHTDFGLPCVREILGENTIAFGLANDAVGYIVPDNDYTLGDPADHYHESVSLGKFTGSSVIKGFIELKKELS